MEVAIMFFVVVSEQSSTVAKSGLIQETVNNMSGTLTQSKRQISQNFHTRRWGNLELL